MDAHAPAESLERKARVLARLAAEGVPINADQPAIGDGNAQEAGPRDRAEIAWRAMALLVVAGRADGLAAPSVERIIRTYGLREHFTPREAAFLQQASPARADRLAFVWRYEAAWALLWALGFVDHLDKPTAPCDVTRALGILQQRSSAQLISDAQRRPSDQLLDEAELIHRYHWAVVEARTHDRTVPASLQPEVVAERRRALNWLIGHGAKDWDAITADT